MPKVPISTIQDVIAKILSKSHVEGDCIVYDGYRSITGYGKVKVGGRKGKLLLVHRIMYEHYKGPIPEGIFVCHSCDNPQCFNIEHLFLGTHDDNMRDMANKKRAFRTTGEKSGVHKLSYKDVENIRKDNRYITIIAKDYGVVKSTISDIKNFKSRRDG